MQVFIIGTPLETAKALDKRRLNRQIQEVKVILDALNGKKAWSNHPCVLQYKGHDEYLRMYQKVLHYWDRGINELINDANNKAIMLTPPFHTQEYIAQMKKRLYTKDSEHYKMFSSYGRSWCNWYWSQSENKFIKYRNGKRIE